MFFFFLLCFYICIYIYKYFLGEWGGGLLKLSTFHYNVPGCMERGLEGYDQDW